MEGDFTYYAFISYSHMDEKWACWLQKKLEHFRLPSVIRKELGSGMPERIRPIFRDATDLGVGRLKEKLGQELFSSRYLLVICSPNSAQPNVQGEHWVDKEIRYFIELGRVDRIIPVIVDGTCECAGEASDCFPPSIREAGLLGIDATKVPKERVLNDVVARILGLRPDVLWMRARRSAIRRRRVITWTAIAVSLLLDAFAYASANYFMERKTYFADYVDVHGVPRGLYPLSREQVAKRSEHYCFVSSRRLVRSVTHANSAGLPIPQTNSEFKNRPIIQRLHYGADGRLMYADHCDRNGHIMLRHVYSGSGEHVAADLESVKSEGAAGTDLFLNASTTSLQHGLFASRAQTGVKSEIKRLDLIRDPQGRVVQVIYRKGKNAFPAKDAEGVSGLKYEMDELGRISELWYLDINGVRRPNRQGVAGRRYQYCGANLRKIEYVDEKGMPTVNDAGWMVCVSQFDANGNSTEDASFGADGRPILHKDGYFRRTSVFNAQGNETSRAYLDVDGRPVLHREGYAKLTFSHDARGDVTELACHGVHGEPVLHKEGYARMTFTYDDHGNVRDERYFSTNGTPVLMRSGFARRTFRYNERGDQTDVAYFGADNRPVICKEGFARMTTEYDDRGLVTELAYYGVNGEYALRKDGCARLRRTYDERGNMTEEAYFGVDGKPVLVKDGYACQSFAYDERGRVTTISCYDLFKQLVAANDGVASWTKKYDDRGNMVEESYFGTDGRPTLINGEYARQTFGYDVHGNLTEVAYYDPDNRRVMCKEGFARFTKRYDDRGNAVDFSYYGVDDHLVLRKAGNARLTKKYDDRGNVIEKGYFGSDGAPMLCKEGYARIEITYDERGAITGERFFDAENQALARPKLYIRPCL